MKITEKFGSRIKEIREGLEISQEELSFRADLHRTYISSIELGKRNVSLVNIEKLAKALECEISDFFNNKKQNNGRK
jgi:transcriptional regulator with XRE-family HTH domain